MIDCRARSPNCRRYPVRTATLAQQAVDCHLDGDIVEIAGLWYEVDRSKTGAASATEDLGVNGLIPAIKATLFHYGAVEEPQGTFGGADQSYPVQKFLDFINDNQICADWSGEFAINKPVSLGLANQVECRECTGRLFLRAMNAMTGPVFIADKFKNNSRWGDLHVSGFGGADYGIRQTDTGIEIRNLARASLGIWGADNMRFWGVYVSPTGNSNLFTAEKLWGRVCGSGWKETGLGYTPHLPGTITSWTDHGAAYSTSQASELNVSVNTPPELALFGPESTVDPVTAGYAGSDDKPKFICLDGRIHKIIHEDRGAGTIWVYPRISASTPANADFIYIFGGGVAFEGSDSNIAEIAAIESMVCGIGVSFAMLYGPTVGTILTDATGVAAQFGNRTEGACFGTAIGTLYLEAADTQILTTSGAVDYDIQAAIVIDLNKIQTTVNPSGPIGEPYQLTPAIVNGTIKSQDGYTLERTKVPQTPFGVGSGPTFTLRRTDQYESYRGDAFTVFLKVDPELNRVTGIDSGRIDVFGTGANDAPSQITFQSPDGYPVNGAASAVFTGFTSAAELVVRWDEPTTSWQVVDLT